MKNVYADIEKLENYVKNNICQNTVFLAMTDYKKFFCTIPEKKIGKNCWDYDISNGIKIKGPKQFTTEIAGKGVDITIEKEYEFKWEPIGDFYFLKLEKTQDC